MMIKTTSDTPALADILAPVAEDMQQLNTVIWQHMHSEIALIRQMAEALITAGGKRLRPAVLLLVSAALGAQGGARHQLAAVIELIHTATLIHDDVVDESELRRGKKTAHTLFGNAASVLVGDFLYSRAFQIMVEIKQLRVMQIVAHATNKIAEGEILQLSHLHNPDIDEAGYRQVITYKTARLFEVSAQLGAVLADAPRQIENRAAEFGRHLGIAFQLLDDWLDYAGYAHMMGKTVGNDLREGKTTLPLITLMRRGNPQQRELARTAIQTGNAARFDDIRAAVDHSGALDYTLQCAQKEAAHAIAALGVLPDSVYRKSLLELCAYSTTRQY
jgi:octaprenyl-diphosphate synthase